VTFSFDSLKPHGDLLDLFFGLIVCSEQKQPPFVACFTEVGHILSPLQRNRFPHLIQKISIK
jgi:hypothetical protein